MSNDRPLDTLGAWWGGKRTIVVPVINSGAVHCAHHSIEGDIDSVQGPVKELIEEGICFVASSHSVEENADHSSKPAIFCVTMLNLQFQIIEITFD